MNGVIRVLASQSHQYGRLGQAHVRLVGIVPAGDVVHRVVVHVLEELTGRVE